MNFPSLNLCTFLDKGAERDASLVKNLSNFMGLRFSCQDLGSTGKQLPHETHVSGISKNKFDLLQATVSA